ncbi:hypothetical protein T03_9987 [Trichinella britovi]|uniref:Uncharacterized protein n=1 Tax=Trichinella britovi TaxID=45882 RepID=A0A0V1C6A7_TRIBR|nr:hypothetical protein T03_9987 [Trichinella britovi]
MRESPAPPPGRPHGGTRSAQSGLPPARVPPSLHRSSAGHPGEADRIPPPVQMEILLKFLHRRGPIRSGDFCSRYSQRLYFPKATQDVVVRTFVFCQQDLSLRGLSRVGLSADEPAEAGLHRHGSAGCSSDSASRIFIRGTGTLSHLRFCRDSACGSGRHWLDPATKLWNRKRLHRGARLRLTRASNGSKPELYSSPFPLWPHSTSESREATTLVGCREPEDLGDILPDEGDFVPRDAEAIYQHVVSVRPVSAGADNLETTPGCASSGQKALMGLSGPWWSGRFPCGRRMQEPVVRLAKSVHSAWATRTAFSRPMAGL